MSDPLQILDERLAPLYEAFSTMPDMKKWIQQLAHATYAELTPEIITGPDGARHLIEKGIASHQANFNAVLTQIQQLDPNFNIACQKGCAYCCNAFIVVLPHEALNIADFINENFSGSQQDNIIAAGSNQKELISNSSLQQVATSYNSPCPFLKDNACSIYEVRPLTCRNWISQDAEVCRKAMESTPPQEVPNNIILMQQVTILFAVHKTFLQMQNLKTEAVPLLAVMPDLLSDVEKAHVKWLQGEAIY